MVTALALLFCGQSASANDVVEAYRVGANDVLRIEVYDEADLTGQVTVNELGEIRRPHIGSVSVSNMTAEEVADEIKKLYADGWLNNPQVSVEILQHRSREVEVYGAIKKPGKYFLTEPTTLREILALAGWIDQKKSSRQVRLQRSESTITMNYEELMTTDQGDIELQDDDMIWIEEGQFVWVSGEVDKPGLLPFTEGMTVLQALTQVGGPTAMARMRAAYVLRGEDRIPVNLRKMQGGKESDMVMLPGDQLFLKESSF